MSYLPPISKCILVMAGGTGGHIFPGLAVAEYLKLDGWRVHWLGNPSGMEYTLVKKYGFTFEGIQFGGLRGKGLLTKLKLPFNLLRAMYQSYQIIRRIKPNVVLGMGGYVTFPAGMISAMSGIPLVLHEQNSIAGLANKVLAYFARKVLCAFPNTLPKSQWVGNPLRGDLMQLPNPQVRYANRQGPLNILVVGGSLGAKALNDIVPQALSLMAVNERPWVVHQAGNQHLEDLTATYARLGVKGQLVAFIDDMGAAYANADVVICRAGAMTVAELAACGVPALLIPFPYAVDDHQTMNAKYLADSGAANCVAQKDLSSEKLVDWIQQLDRSTLQAMSTKALSKAKPFATRDVAEICKEVSI